MRPQQHTQRASQQQAPTFPTVGNFEAVPWRLEVSCCCRPCRNAKELIKDKSGRFRLLLVRRLATDTLVLSAAAFTGFTGHNGQRNQHTAQVRYWVLPLWRKLTGTARGVCQPSLCRFSSLRVHGFRAGMACARSARSATSASCAGHRSWQIQGRFCLTLPSRRSQPSGLASCASAPAL